MTHPYVFLSDRSYWKKSVASRNMFDIDQLWHPKFNILPTDTVVSYGSCFAQHFGKALLKRGYKWTSFESPGKQVPESIKKKYNYNIFSARTANIYTTSLFNQWVEWAVGIKAPPDEIWEENGRFHDPFRPTIEPDGFESPDELYKSRQETISAFRKSLESSKVLVFTLGLTESWYNIESGYEYPLCPGTAAGKFNSSLHTFKNQDFEYVRKSFLSALKHIKLINPHLKIILTVSPVPLVATNSGHHVLSATVYSKSVLRAVAGQIAHNHKNIDYFPSFEIISSIPFKSVFYEANLRGVNHCGVDFVMTSFFDCLHSKFGSNEASAQKKLDMPNKDDVICEEELLEAFDK